MVNKNPSKYFFTSDKKDTPFKKLHKDIRGKVEWISWTGVVFLKDSINHTMTMQVGCIQTNWLVIDIVLSQKNEVNCILCTSLKVDWTCKSDSWKKCIIRCETNKIENPIKD